MLRYFKKRLNSVIRARTQHVLVALSTTAVLVIGTVCSFGLVSALPVIQSFAAVACIITALIVIQEHL